MHNYYIRLLKKKKITRETSIRLIAIQLKKIK